MNIQVFTPQAETFTTQEGAITAEQPKAATRLLYVDNLRIFLTILVVLHHLMNIYAASGGWIYIEGRQDMVTAILGKWFTVINQSYFMGLFMLIAAYFVPGSYDRKGPAVFIKDRLVRLGIPLVILSWIIRPGLIYIAQVNYNSLDLPFFEWYFGQYFHEYGLIGGGPLWFITALLIFSIGYAILRMLFSSHASWRKAAVSFPANRHIALLALVIAAASFIVRLWFPADRVFIPLVFQLADFPQYIALFILGIVAYRHDWLNQLPGKTGKLWMVISIIFILLWPPLVLMLGALEDAAPFQGGWHWQSALAAVWQAFLGIAMCVTVIRLSVSVPVLSTHNVVAAPSISTAGTRRVNTCR